MDYVLLAMLILHCSMLMLRVALQFDRTFLYCDIHQRLCAEWAQVGVFVNI